MWEQLKGRKNSRKYGIHVHKCKYVIYMYVNSDSDSLMCKPGDVQGEVLNCTCTYISLMVDIV